MAKPSKGKKALKAQQKTEKSAQPEAGKAVTKEPLTQNAKAVQVEKPKNVEGQANSVEPKPVEPAVPVSLANRAFTFVKAHASLFTFAIILIMGFMFWLRTVPSHDLVFTNWQWINGGTYVNVAEDDGVYHMRLLDNTLQHFPFRILYDPFTHFPYGSTIHFGPLFELIPAAFILIAGLGHPSQMLIDTLAAYFPAVLGTLIAIPVYYIGKKLFGRPAGLIAAFALAFMPGSFFFHSVLGSTDHHVAEVLFMACTIACLVYALDAARSSKLSLEMLKSHDWKTLKMPLIYAALAGIFMGSYMLIWVGGLLLAFSIFAFFTIQAIIDHYRGRSLDYLLILSAFFFIIPVLMILPYCMSNLTFQVVYYSLTQPLIFLGAFIGVGVEYGISKVLKESKAEKWAYPVAIVGAAIIGILLMVLVLPGMNSVINYALTQLTPSGGLLTVEEASPTFINQYTGQISFAIVWASFYLAFPAALIGLILLIFRVFKRDRPSELMFLVWNLVMVWALIAQNRYTYYFAVNAALLTAFLAAYMFDIMDIDSLKANFKKKVDSWENFQRFAKKNLGSLIGIGFIVLAFTFISIYPALPLSDTSGSSTPEGVLFQTAQSGTALMPHEWYDALMWMRNHTPDPQGSPQNASFNFTSGQYYPSGGARYDYPASAYGVMSWWDYGHDIEYVANRIPNANPFQAGIIEENGTTGASPYFTSTDENQSVQMLDELGTRYVVIDNQMVTGKFGAIEQWIGDTSGWETDNTSTYLWTDGTNLYSSNNDTVRIIQDSDKWNNSVINRLYYEDADDMSHYRLVYDSAGSYYVDRRAMQWDTTSGQLTFAGFTANPVVIDNYTQANMTYQLYSQYVVSNDQQGSLYFYGARAPEKFVKIFELVKGATISGSAPDGSIVTATLELKTDWDREFNYTNSAVAQNGVYSFTVPYPTEKMQGPGYSYGIMPETKYVITYGNTTKEVDVPETAVMNGGSVQVN